MDRSSLLLMEPAVARRAAAQYASDLNHGREAELLFAARRARVGARDLLE